MTNCFNFLSRSTLTPKKVYKKRLAKNKDVTGRQQCSLEMHSEKEIPLLDDIKHDYQKKIFKARDRELKEDPYRNPYAVPERLRVTTKCLPPRKQKRVPFIMDEPHTVCDIYPTFFKVVEGRPIRSFYDIKAYMTNLRDITLYRANAGYLKEEIIQIETRISTELEDYEAVNDAVETIKMNFIIFAEEGYKEAKYKQHLAAEKATELENMIEQLEGYSFRFAKLKNQVSSIVAIYDKLLRYKRFLNSVSPDWWRERYEELCTLGSTICSKFFTYLESEEVESATVYKKSALSLAQLQPQLYFRRPMELSTILECTSRQCLNYMEIECYFSTNLAKVNRYRKEFKANMLAECTEMQEIIEIFRDKVQEMEERKAEYKATFDKLLQTEFQRLFASYDSIKLFTCVKYVHSRVLRVKGDRKDCLKTLMHHVERMYFDLCTKLDSLNLKVVKIATKQIFSEDLKIMKQAYDAQRQLKEYDVLCKSLHRSFEPPRRKTRN